MNQLQKEIACSNISKITADVAMSKDDMQLSHSDKKNKNCVRDQSCGNSFAFQKESGQITHVDLAGFGSISRDIVGNF